MSTRPAASDVHLLTRGQLLSTGHSERDVRRRLAPGGDLTTLAPGLYVDGGVWAGADESDRHLLLVRAAVTTSRVAGVVSHGSAAVCHGLPTLRASRRAVHLTRPDLPRSRQRAGHLLHGGRLGADETTRCDGLLVTSVARTVGDVARTDGWLAGLVVADQALRAGLDRGALRDGLARLVGRKGAGVLPRVATLADQGADNPGETLARALVLEVTEALGLPPPQTQARVSEGDRVAYADLRVGRVLIEFDGRWKYARTRPFGDGEAPSEVLWAEKQREDWLRGMGFVVVRLTWTDVWGPGRATAASRVHRALVEHAHPRR